MNYESYYEREHLKVTFWSVLLPIDPDQSGVALTAGPIRAKFRGSNQQILNMRYHLPVNKNAKIILKTKKYIFFIPTSSNAFRHI